MTDMDLHINNIIANIIGMLMGVNVSNTARS